MNLIIVFIWSILAILSFINPWIGLPLLTNIVNITFGILNMLVIITWIVSFFVMRKENKKLQKLIEEANKEEIVEEIPQEEEKPKKKRAKGSKGR
jgi:uncharacterized membrane protein (DUF485 family)